MTANPLPTATPEHPPDDSEFGGDLESLLACARRLHDLCTDDELLASRNWSALCGMELALLADLLACHLEAEEQSGYLFDLVAHKPHLTPRVEALLGEHRVLLHTLDSVRALVRASGIAPRAAEEVLGLLEAINVHEHAERALVQKAVAEDLGNGA